MSSLRLASRTSATADEAPDAEWVSVRSPLREQQQPPAPGIVLSLAVARERYRRGIEHGVELDLDSLTYGSGDAELASDVERSVDLNWDR